MNLITEKEFTDFIKKRNEINELILAKTAQLSYLLYNKCPDGECYNCDFEVKDGKIIIQFESYHCREICYDTFYLPIEFLFDESYPEKYKLIHEEELKKEKEEKIKKENEKKEKDKLKFEEFERKEYERLKLKYTKKEKEI